MKKKYLAWVCAVTMTASMVFAAGAVYAEEGSGDSLLTAAEDEVAAQDEEATEIALSDDEITIDGEQISSDPTAPVYVGEEIIYYEAGQEDSLYGEGEEGEAHTEEEAAEHTVVTITAPGTYRVTGTISRGQIAVDLGEESRKDPSAVVNLILDQADITCTVAPAIVVYNGYECGSDDTETAAKDVDTSAAGFNLILADGSENTINGSHVAKIYQEGTTQEEVNTGEAKKKWKFDAAIDSLVSFNINGEELGDGKLNVTADNEGISSALHMTVNGGEILISSGDDAINASEDGVSVFTMNHGVITCDSGLGEEGDGIDSNGWIVYNGGYTVTSANANSQDSGLDADLGIYINGGTVLASGNMYDEVSADSEQIFLVLNFSDQVEEGQLLMLKNSEDEPVAAFSTVNNFTTTVYSSDLLEEGDYTLYKVSSVTGDLTGSIYTSITAYEGEIPLQYSATAMMRPGGGQMPEGMGNGERPEMPEGMEEGERPEMPEGMEEGERPEMPEGMEEGERPEMSQETVGQEEPSTIFTISGKLNTFSQITEEK